MNHLLARNYPTGVDNSFKNLPAEKNPRNIVEMSTAENAKLILRYLIRDELSEKLRKTCNMKSRLCRGGSRDLYALLIKSKAIASEMNIDSEHLQIVSGMGHTFIRYKDDIYKRYLYIDPTIAQFNSSFEGIFVGDEQDLRNIVIKQKNLKGYKLNLGDYLGPDYEAKTSPLPPLKIESQMMEECAKGGGTRRAKKYKIRRSTVKYRS